MIFEIVPSECFDGRFEIHARRGDGPGFGQGQPDFAIGRERDSFVAGIPGLDILDLAGIAAAVVIDGDAVNAGFGEGSENDGLVAGADVVDGRGG